MAELNEQKEYLKTLCKAVEKGGDVDGILDMVNNPPDGCDPSVEISFDGDPSAGVKDGNLFILAVVKGHYELGLSLLDTEKFSANSMRLTGGYSYCNALHYFAMEVPDPEQRLAREYIKHGVVVDHLDKDQETPLITAAKSNNVSAFRLFKELGADATRCDDRGKDALYYFADNGNTAMCRELVEEGISAKSVYDRLTVKDNESIRKLMDHLTEPEGLRYLKILRDAVCKGDDTDKIIEMVNNPPDSCDPSVEINFKNDSPLEGEKDGNLFIFAVSGDKYQLGLALLETGKFSPESQKLTGGWAFCNALHFAAGYDKDPDQKFARAMIKAGVPLEHRDCTEEVPIITAAKFGNPAAFRVFREAGADFMLCDNQGKDALYYFAEKGNAPMCRELIADGVSPKAVYDCLAVKDDEAIRNLMDCLTEGHGQMAVSDWGWNVLDDHMISYRKKLADNTTLVTQFDLKNRTFKEIQSMFTANSIEISSASPLQDLDKYPDQKHVKHAGQLLRKKHANKKNV